MHIWRTRGEGVHTAKISAKCGDLKYLDADKDDVVGTFRDFDCAICTKCKKVGKGKTRTQKAGR